MERRERRLATIAGIALGVVAATLSWWWWLSQPPVDVFVPAVAQVAAALALVGATLVLASATYNLVDATQEQRQVSETQMELMRPRLDAVVGIVTCAYDESTTDSIRGLEIRANVTNTGHKPVRIDRATWTSDRLGDSAERVKEINVAGGDLDSWVLAPMETTEVRLFFFPIPTNLVRGPEGFEVRIEGSGLAKPALFRLWVEEEDERAWVVPLPPPARNRASEE